MFFIYIVDMNIYTPHIIYFLILKIIFQQVKVCFFAEKTK